jgi:hypothetical protein
MPYGPEVTDEERDGRGTIYQRGLHLVCYQSSIMRGFKFIQEGSLHFAPIFLPLYSLAYL